MADHDTPQGALENLLIIFEAELIVAGVTHDGKKVRKHLEKIYEPKMAKKYATASYGALVAQAKGLAKEAIAIAGTGEVTEDVVDDARESYGWKMGAKGCSICD